MVARKQPTWSIDELVTLRDLVSKKIPIFDIAPKINRPADMILRLIYRLAHHPDRGSAQPCNEYCADDTGLLSRIKIPRAYERIRNGTYREKDDGTHVFEPPTEIQRTINRFNIAPIDGQRLLAKHIKHSFIDKDPELKKEDFILYTVEGSRPFVAYPFHDNTCRQQVIGPSPGAGCGGIGFHGWAMTVDLYLNNHIHVIVRTPWNKKVNFKTLKAQSNEFEAYVTSLM